MVYICIIMSSMFAVCSLSAMVSHLGKLHTDLVVLKKSIGLSQAKPKKPKYLEYISENMYIVHQAKDYSKIIIIQLLLANITQFKCSALVNAANEELTYEEGLNGAVYQAAGKESLQELCEKIRSTAKQRGERPCPPGQARLTENPQGSTMPCDYIIHAVAPHCSPILTQPMTQQQKETLANAYVNSIKTAVTFNKNPENIQEHYEFALITKKQPIVTIAFPALGTGILGCKMQDAAETVAEAVVDYCIKQEIDDIAVIKFLFNERSTVINYYVQAFKKRSQSPIV